MSWRPLIDGDLEERAREALAELVAAIQRVEPDSAGLASGAAGLAVFLSYYGAVFDDEAAEERATELLEGAIEMVAAQPMAPTLYGGFTGVAWAVEHLAGADPDDVAAGDDDPTAAIDEALAGLLSREAWDGPYDLISGQVGLAVYALERLPRTTAAACLGRIVADLDDAAERTPAGATWHTRPELLPPWQREIAPRGYHNLGLAHGVPGVLAVLARAAQAGVAPERARALLEDGARWLLAQRIADHPRGCFASWLTGDERDRTPSRLAWCYGDLGVAAALMLAARAAGSGQLEREALAIARAAAARAERDAGVSDAGLCHGALGNGHIFNRLYQATGDEGLRQAALTWLARGLAMRAPGQGVGGFLSYVPATDGTPDWQADAGLLTGAAGIGLALLAACTDLVPNWDRVLLVDVPPGDARG